MKEFLKNKYFLFSTALALLSILGVGYQNCAKTQFTREIASVSTKADTAIDDNGPLHPADCSFNGATIKHGASVTAYKQSSAAYNQSCQPETRVCSNGVLSGSFNFGSCSTQAPAACLFDGRTIPHGESVKAYQNSTVGPGETCVKQHRVCQDGHLTGSFSFGRCEVGTRLACLFNGKTIPHGQEVTAFQNSSVDYGQSCKSQKRKCDNGALTGCFSYASCAPEAPESCLFNGKTMAHGESVKAYQTSTVPFGQSCVSQNRACSNGKLSGSYKFGTCSPGEPASCQFNGQTLAHGQSVVTYSKSTVEYGQKCDSVKATRTCQNGKMSGDSSFKFASCQVDQPEACLFKGKTIAHGQSIQTYKKSEVPYGAKCESQKRTCSNGSLSGSYKEESCEVEPPRSCTFNGQTIPSGSSVKAYQTSKVPFGQSCRAQSRTCTDGQLSGQYTKGSCVQEKPKSCKITIRYPVRNDEGAVSIEAKKVKMKHGEKKFLYSAYIQWGKLKSDKCLNGEERVCYNGKVSGDGTKRFESCEYHHMVNGH
ncbi:MAG: hypothetical protein ACAH59_02385 [Pseudobdellovibrionaceae bacterium]